MTFVLAIGVAALAGVGGWRLWAVQRDLAGLRAGLDARTDDRVDMHLRVAREELGRLEVDRERGLGPRVQRAETVAAHLANGCDRLNQRLGAVEGRLQPIEEWVQHWAGQARR